MTKCGLFSATVLCLSTAFGLSATPIVLGNAGSYAALAGSAVTNTGPTKIFGNLGVSPGSAISGFPPGIVMGGTMHSADAHAAAAQADALVAYNALAGLAPTLDLTDQDLGGLTLTPGVYSFSSSAGLTGQLTLNMLGDPNSLFVFQIGSTLKTAPGSSVILVNGEECCNVFWQVGSSATLDTTTDFIGNILALTSITMNTGATIDYGRALALNGALTMDSNVISFVDCDDLTHSAIPEPGTLVLLGAGLLGLVVARRSARRKKT